MARAAGGRVLSPGVPGQGMNPFVIDRGDSEELLQRIGSLRRLIEVMVGRASAPSAARPWTTPWRATTPRAPRAHRLPGLLRLPAGERDAGDRPPAAALRHRQPAPPALRRGRRPAGQRGAGHRLRPAPAGTGAAARRRDGLHRDGVGRRRPGPQAPPAGGGRGVEHHAAPRGRGLHGLAWRSAPASTGWGCSSSPRTCRTSSPRTPPEPSPATPVRALLQNAAFKLLLQQDAAAVSTVGEAFDLPEELQRWLLSCPGATGCCWPGATAFPSASRPPRRRPRSSSGGPDPGTRPRPSNNPIKKGMSMKLNP